MHACVIVAACLGDSTRMHAGVVVSMGGSIAAAAADDDDDDDDDDATAVIVRAAAERVCMCCPSPRFAQKAGVKDFIEKTRANYELVLKVSLLYEWKAGRAEARSP